MKRFLDWVKRNWKWLLPTVILLFPVATFLCFRLGLCGRCSDADLKCVLAEFHGVDEDHLFLNIPPEYSRYPGTILLAPENIRLETTDSSDATLTRGHPYEFGGSFREAARAGGSAANNVLSAVTRSESVANVRIEIDPGRSVDSDARALLDKVNRSTLAGALKEKRLANIIHKAFEGEVTIRAEYADTLSAEAYQREQDRVASVAGSLRVDFGTGQKKDVAWRFNDVYAFIAMDVASLLEPFDEAVVNAPTGPVDTTMVVRKLLSFDPLEIRDLKGTLKEIGPSAGTSLMKVIVEGDSVTRTRGTKVLRELPESARPVVRDPSVSLRDPNPSVRGWAVLEAAESPNERNVELLTNALRDDDPAVRLLAAQAIGEFGSEAAVAAPALEELTRDAAPDVRQAASQTLVAVTTPAGMEAVRVDSALDSDDPSVQRAHLGLVESVSRQQPERAVDLLRRGISSQDASVRLEALRVAGEVEGISDSLEQEVERLQQDPDPRVRRGAELLLRRSRRDSGR